MDTPDSWRKSVAWWKANISEGPVPKGHVFYEVILYFTSGQSAAGLSLRAKGQGFPLAVISTTRSYFEEKQKESLKAEHEELNSCSVSCQTIIAALT